MNNEKIRLRAMEPEDLDVLYQIENNQKLWDVGTTNVPYSRFALQNYIVSQTNDIFADRQLRLMIENEEGQTIGIIDIINFATTSAGRSGNRDYVGVANERLCRSGAFEIDGLLQAYASPSSTICFRG